VTDPPVPARMRTLEEVYGYGPVFAQQEAFRAALDQSLAPRGLDLLFDLVAGLGLPPGSVAVDVGARDGCFCIELAHRFGFAVHGIEPVRRHLDTAARDLADFAAAEPGIAARIRIDYGVAEQLADPDASADLIWCRDVLVHVQDLETAFREFHRVLRPGGHAVIYQVTATEWLTPAEAAWLLPRVGMYASSVDPQHFEAAIIAAGLSIAQDIQLHGEWREHLEENDTGLGSQQLLWVSRLLRNRPAYEERFGTDAYEAMLTDGLWVVYQMIGKLNPRVYVLSR
jgi:SAM-dependent methyltransferase